MDPTATDNPTDTPATLHGCRDDDNVPERAIYVACLASYNNGRLFGEWIDAAQDVDTIRATIAAMLRRSPYPNVTVPCPECEPREDVCGVCGALFTTTTPPGENHGRPEGAECAGCAKGAEPGPACSACKGRGTVPSAEEWAVHDYQGFEGITLSEYPDLEEVAALALALEEHGEPFAKWYENGDGRAKDPSEWADAFQEVYRGTYRDVAAYAEQYVDDCYDLDKMMGNLAVYFDYERLGRDLELGGDIWTAEGGDGIYVFDNH